MVNNITVVEKYPHRQKLTLLRWEKLLIAAAGLKSIINEVNQVLSEINLLRQGELKWIY